MPIDVTRLSKETVYGIEKKSGDITVSTMEKVDKDSYPEVVAKERTPNSGEIANLYGIGRSIDVFA